MRRSIRLAAVLLLCAASMSADDFHLKDGSTISGSIVGYDDSSFKVQTSYGFALVRKDQVASITISDGAKNGAQKQSATNTADGGAAQSSSTSKPQKLLNAAAPMARTAPATSPKTAPVVPPPPVAPATAALASVASEEEKPPDPGPIREKVDGSAYVNESYGFRMYKPPDWKVIEGARSVLPGAIAALGTNDQTTYLLIGAAPAGKSITVDIDATDQRLHSVMDNFRPISEMHVNISGTQAIERKFRGSVDQKDWSGTVVYLTRDGEFYTIFGMTLAETDLVQIQENVISRAISSIKFGQ